MFFLLLLVPSFGYAQLTSPREKLFVTALLGRTTLSPSDSLPNQVQDRQWPEKSNYVALGLGYRWNLTSLQFTYANLGNPGLNVDNKYLESHRATFMGVGGNVHLWFLDFKFGVGAMKDIVLYKKGGGAETLTARPNESPFSSMASYLGLGAAINIAPNWQLLGDFTVYSWTTNEKRRIGINRDGDNLEETDNVATTVSVGVRYYIDIVIPGLEEPAR